MQFLRTQIATLVGRSSLGLPVLGSVSPPSTPLNTPFTYTFSASSATGVSWSVVSGTLPPGLTLTTAGVLSGTPTAAGNYSFTVGATNNHGTQPASCVHLVQYSPTMDPITVVGKPVSYTIPNLIGTVVSQQWYNNTGSGPVIISGATGSTYTPVAGDVGKYLSVRGVTSTGATFATAEFSAAKQIVRTTGLVTGTNLTSGGSSVLNGVQSSFTLKCVATVRSIGSSGYYIDQVLAPGTYNAYDSITVANLDKAPSNTQSFSIGVSIRDQKAPPAVLDQQVDSAPSTNTRPAGNTGSGFFVKGGSLYDGNGHKFRIRGVNQCHYDSTPPGILKTGANVVRWAVYMTLPWVGGATFSNKTLNDIYLNQKILSMPAPQVMWASFVGTISGNILTVTSTNYGNVVPGYSISGTGTSFTVSPYGTGGTTGTGGVGTYQISVSQTVGSPTTMTHYFFASGSKDPLVLACATQTWVDQAATWTTYNNKIILNILNEWGPDATSFSGYISGGVLTVTTGSAGTFYRNMSIDVPSNGTVKITSFGTGTGGTGTYNIDNSGITAGSSASPVSMRDSTWRVANIAAVTALRAAGYLCPICIDGPNAGQSYTTMTNGDALAILNADPQSNVIFSVHEYGANAGSKIGNFSTVASALYSAAQSSLGTNAAGLVFIIGEFGPGFNVGPSPTNLTPIELMGTCEAYNIGYIPWAWDDPPSGTGTGTALGFAMCQNAGSFTSGGGGFKTQDPTELTDFGRTVVMNPTYGLLATSSLATSL